MFAKQSRRIFLKLMGLTTAGVSFPIWYCTPKTVRRPNILFCISDDQSYPHASIYGCKFVQTPTFDRIAQEGILFHNAFVSSPSCCPSRGSVLTGQNFYRLKEASMNHTIWPGGIQVYPDILKDAGYHIGYTGKGWAPGNWLVSGRKDNPSGTSYNTHTVDPPGRGMSNIDYAKNFEDFLEKRPTNAPFCFWFGPSEPHRKYEDGVGLRYGKKLEDVQVPDFFPDSNEVRSDLLDYGFEIEYYDKHLGRMLKILEERDELDNTIIVMTSDNGMPFPRAKATLYDYGARVPLAIRWGDKIQPGRVVEDFISFCDFAPTFLQAAGLPIPEEITGKSLMNILISSGSGQIEPSRNFAIYGIERHFPEGRPEGAGYPMRAIRTKEYLYIKNYSPELNPVGDHPGAVWPSDDPVGGFGDLGGSPTKTYMWKNRKKYKQVYKLAFGKRLAEELYNIRQDPYNMNNLANDPKYNEVKKELRIKLQQYLVETEDPRILDNGRLFDDIMKKYPVMGSNLSNR